MKFVLNENKKFKEKDEKYQNFKEEIGGSWEEIGKLGFDFIKDKLEPTDSMVDIACGSLRIGRFIVDYLEPGNYMGIELQEELLNSAVYDVLGLEKYEEKKPKLLCDSHFNFIDFKTHWADFKIPKVGLAQSLFTHLNFEDIKLCLNNLEKIIDKDFTLYATFHSEQGNSGHAKRKKIQNKPLRLLEGSRNMGGNPWSSDSNPHTDFWYSKNDLKKLSQETNWELKEIFDWNHPRKQLMTVWTLKTESVNE